MRSHRSTQPRRYVLSLITLVVLTSACGAAAPRTIDVRPRPSRTYPAPEAAAPHYPPAAVAADAAIRARQAADLRLVVLTVAWQEAAKPKPAPVVRVGTATHAYAEPSTGSGGCGGDLPPCYVMERESGGSYSAYNPTGCGGNGCYGKWQFSGAWAGKLGLPADIASATPEQQDEAARQLYAGGAGCSNWGC